MTSLTIFHLCYLGVMFGGDSDENVSSLEVCIIIIIIIIIITVIGIFNDPYFETLAQFRILESLCDIFNSCHLFYTLNYLPHTCVVYM